MKISKSMECMNKKIITAVFFIALGFGFSTASAQEISSGDACASEKLNHVIQSGGPTDAGKWSLLRCDGAAWRPLAVWTANGRMGVGTASPEASLHSAGEIVTGATGLACGTSTSGAVRFNSSTGTFQGCNGLSWCDLPGPCPHPGPPDCPVRGNQCADGSYYIGRASSGNASIVITAADSPTQYAWGSVGTWRGATNVNDGEAQSATLAAFGAAAHPAADYCIGLSAHSKTDWYLPAQNELLLVGANGASLGMNMSGNYPEGFYWTSTEGIDGNNGVSIKAQDSFVNNTDYKANTHPVRCVRKVPD